MGLVIFIVLVLLPFLLALALIVEWTVKYFRDWRDEFGTKWTAFVTAGAILLGWLVWLPALVFTSVHSIVTILFAVPGLWLSSHALTNPEHKAYSGMFLRILLMQLSMAIWLVAIAGLDKAHW